MAEQTGRPHRPRAYAAQQQTVTLVTEVTAVIFRKDGRREDLGVVSRSHADDVSRLADEAAGIGHSEIFEIEQEEAP